jgi:hypothetical protein
MSNPYKKLLAYGKRDVDDFAKFPGVRGCATKMLAGGGCGAAPEINPPRDGTLEADPTNTSGLCYAVPPNWSPSCSAPLLKPTPQQAASGWSPLGGLKKDCRAHVDCAGPDPFLLARAFERLESAFAFAGITELWGLSTCLFHRLLGTAPAPGDATVSNAQAGDGAKPSKYAGSAFVDVADELLFAKVLDRFEADLACVTAELAKGSAGDTRACARPGATIGVDGTLLGPKGKSLQFQNAAQVRISPHRGSNDRRRKRRPRPGRL